MKRMRFLIPILALCLVCLAGCGATAGVQRHIPASCDRPPAQVHRAMNVVQLHFWLHFDDCRLLEITYDPQYNDRRAQAEAAQYGADEAMVLLSSFEVGPKGGGGSLNPNSTYRRWQWILTRSGNGPWRLRTWGYG